MASHSIHGGLLEVTVVSCSQLRDRELITRQDPYVCIKYSGSKSRTSTCKDGGRNPKFQEKFVFTLIDGFRELNVDVWNKNTFTPDDHIGSGTISLAKALSQGFDESYWPLQTNNCRQAGEIRLIMRYTNANNAPPPVPVSFPPSPQPSYHQPPPPAGGVYSAGYPPYYFFPPAPYPPYPPYPPQYPPNPAYGSHYPPGSPGMYPRPPY